MSAPPIVRIADGRLLISGRECLPARKRQKHLPRRHRGNRHGGGNDARRRAAGRGPLRADGIARNRAGRAGNDRAARADMDRINRRGRRGRRARAGRRWWKGRRHSRAPAARDEERESEQNRNDPPPGPSRVGRERRSNDGMFPLPHREGARGWVTPHPNHHVVPRSRSLSSWRWRDCRRAARAR